MIAGGKMKAAEVVLLAMLAAMAGAGSPAHSQAAGDAAHGCVSVDATLPSAAGAGYQGAMGDGRHDDWRSLQTHIAWVNTHPQAANHGCLFIPAATFLFTRPLNMCATLGRDGAACTYPKGITVEGMGKNVSVLEPRLASAGPALDFGGSNNSVLRNVGVEDASSGDHSSVGVLSSHGGQNGVAGDNLRVADVAVSVAHSATRGAVGELFCGTDVSSVNDNEVWSQSGPALIAGDGLGLAAGVVSSPFYALASPRNPEWCRGDNGFTHFGLGANSSFTAYGIGTAVQLTGSAEYDSWGNIYVTGDGPMAPGHGIIDIMQSNSEGNWLNLLGIRTEYHGPGSGIHAIEMIHGGSRGGLLGGALATTRPIGFDFGCDSSASLMGLMLAVDGSPIVTDCRRIWGLSGNVGNASAMVPAGYPGAVSNVRLSEYGTGVVGDFVKNLGRATQVLHSSFCASTCSAGPAAKEHPAEGPRR